VLTNTIIIIIKLKVKIPAKQIEEIKTEVEKDEVAVAPIVYMLNDPDLGIS
jgi:hypothetical protein